MAVLFRLRESPNHSWAPGRPINATSRPGRQFILAGAARSAEQPCQCSGPRMVTACRRASFDRPSSVIRLRVTTSKAERTIVAGQQQISPRRPMVDAWVAVREVRDAARRFAAHPRLGNPADPDGRVRSYGPMPRRYRFDARRRWAFAVTGMVLARAGPGGHRGVIAARQARANPGWSRVARTSVTFASAWHIPPGWGIPDSLSSPR